MEAPETLEQKEAYSFHVNTHTPDTNQARTRRTNSHLGWVREANASGDKHCQKDHSPLKAKSTAEACCFSPPIFLSLHKLLLSEESWAKSEMHQQRALSKGELFQITGMRERLGSQLLQQVPTRPSNPQSSELENQSIPGRVSGIFC